MLSAGKIEGIFLCEFHLEKGPKIVCQVPEDTPNQNQVLMDEVFIYFIPKNFYGKTIKFNYSGQTILGCPVSLVGEEYERNCRRFNCCFLFNSTTDTSNYENVVRKLNLFLEENFQYEARHGNCTKLDIQNLLKTVHHDLSTSNKCHYIAENKLSLHLQVDVNASNIPTISNTHVPIFSSQNSICVPKQSDLVAKKIIPLINGEKPVGQLAREADVELKVAKECIKSFVLHGDVIVVPLFQYCNMYITTPRIKTLFEDPQLQNECLSFVSLPGKRGSMLDIIKFYTSLACSRVDELCIRFNPRSKGIHEIKLIQFGLMKNFLRKLDRFPVNKTLEPLFYCATSHKNPKKGFDYYLSGTYSYDEICDIKGMSHNQLDEKLDVPGIINCWK